MQRQNLDIYHYISLKTLHITLPFKDLWLVRSYLFKKLNVLFSEDARSHIITDIKEFYIVTKDFCLKKVVWLNFLKKVYHGFQNN